MQIERKDNFLEVVLNPAVIGFLEAVLKPEMHAFGSFLAVIYVDSWPNLSIMSFETT